MDTQLFASQVAPILNKDSAFVAQVGQIIKPDREAHGRGRRAYYSFRNVVEIAIYIALNGFGVPRKQIAQHVSALRASAYRWLDEDGHDGWIALDGQWKWAAGNTPAAIVEVLDCSGPTTALVLINLGSIKNHIRRAVGAQERVS